MATDRNIGIFGAGGEIGRNIVRVNTLLKRTGKPHLPITHLVEGFHTRERFLELLGNDPVRGPIGGEICTEGENRIHIDDQVLMWVQCPADKMVDWRSRGVWGVLEASGGRVKEELAQEHITHGNAAKVVVTAPTKGSDIARSLIVGYNEEEYSPTEHHVLTNESCTTKSAVHIAGALQEAFGLRAISLTTVHAETGPERRNLIERSGKVEQLSALDFRPESTGSQGALAKLFPKTQVSAKAYRVPVPDASVSDITFKLGKKTTEQHVRAVLEEAVREGIWQIVESIRSSAELIGNLHDAVIARDEITVIDGNLARVRSGYDNAFAPARAALDAMQFVRNR